MSKRRYLIGIVGSSMGENSFGSTKPYMAHLSAYGDVVILAPQRGIVPILDLVVLPGGKDMPSYRYGRVPGYHNTDPDQFKEFFAVNNLKQYIEAGIPIWGTCLGMQQLAVHFGSDMVQNISSSHGYSGEDRGTLVNTLVFPNKFAYLEVQLLKKVKEKNKKAQSIKCCSLHHQGVPMNKIGESLDIIAHTADGIVEAIRHKELPIAGGQFHVEEDFNPLGDFLIRELLSKSPNFKNENERTSIQVEA